MFDYIRNFFSHRYHGHPEAVIVSCFYNPENSPYRLIAFQKFYKSIRHLNHRIIECVIGDAPSQLPYSPHITRVQTETLLWHKEALLNKVISELPAEFQYVFWVDADVLFTNLNWLTQGVDALQNVQIVQPFEYCIHLDRNELKPSFDVEEERPDASMSCRPKKMWRSFSANYATNDLSDNANYDVHGHVGFAWGARRSVLEKVPLYDKALIGGADHIIAHAAAGQIPHACITKAFADNIEEVLAWSRLFYAETNGQLSYVQGDIYHIWHGDIEKRQYLKRIMEFAKDTNISERDENGLYVGKRNPRIARYYRNREVGWLGWDTDDFSCDCVDFFDANDFMDVMGYALQDMLSQPRYSDDYLSSTRTDGSESADPSVLVEAEADAAEASGPDWSASDHPGYVPDDVPDDVPDTQDSLDAESESGSTFS